MPLRLLLILLFCLLSFASATQEVLSPRFRVLYSDPAQAEYAQRVANEGERALDILEPLFGYTLGRVNVRLDAGTDVYNAFAIPLPRPTVALRLLFPNEVSLGYSEDELYTLMLHELTHLMHLRYTEGQASLFNLPPLGLVGENVASIPPSWFLEGIAVWVESAFTAGGRAQDALTIGMLHSEVLGDAWPALADISLTTFSDWPGGAARYLYGGAFMTYLIELYGFETVLATLRAYNAGGFFRDFSGAWQSVTGRRLELEWADWQRLVRSEAEARAATVQANPILTDTGRSTRAPAISPDGRRLAWVASPATITVAELGVGEGRLENPRPLLRDRLPTRLVWRDNRSLVYARILRFGGTEFSELFSLDTETLEERQLTSGARAILPGVTPEGCLLYVQDVLPAPAQVFRLCDGVTDTLWTAAAGVHPLGLSVSPSGRVALSVWRNGFVDLALLENGTLRYLTQDSAQHLEPVWQTDERLLFRSDIGGEVFDLYALELPSGNVTRLSRTLGGAFNPAARGETLFYAELAAGGYNLAEVTARLEEPLSLAREPLLAARDAVANPVTYPVQPYSPLPSLLPYGWLPNEARLELSPFRLGLSASLYGQDDSALHSYALTAGFDTGLTGALGSVYAHLDYRYGSSTLYTLGTVPLTFSARVGIWPYVPHRAPSETLALGVRGGLEGTFPLDGAVARYSVSVGALRLPAAGVWQPEFSASASLSNQRADAWGYRGRGLRGVLTGVVSPSDAGLSFGAWFDGFYYAPLSDLVGLPGTLELHLRSGYRPARAIPLPPDPFSALFSVGYRHSLPIGWRYGDGLYALERVTLEPRLRTHLGAGFMVGADVTLSLDTVFNYEVPTSFSLSAGYMGGFWYSFGLRVPL